MFYYKSWQVISVKNNSSAAVLAIMLLLTSSSLLIVLSSNDAVITLAQPKKRPSSSLSSHQAITKGKAAGFGPGSLQFAEEPPFGTEPLTPASSNNSAAAIDIAHRLVITSVNASKVQAKLGTPCLPELSRFILPPKEARFTVVKQCVTITGRVVWTHYFNDDGDANFNVVLDPAYKNMLGPGSYGKVFFTKYGVPAMHMEIVCQDPVTSKSLQKT